MPAASTTRISVVPPPSGDVNLRIFTPLARWLRDRHGVAEFERVARSSGLAADDFDGRSRWTSLESFEAFLQGVRDLAGSDEEFQKACVHRMGEQYGVFKFAFRALSPIQVYRKAMRQMGLVSKISRIEIVESNRTSLVWRYYSEKQESRLSCVSRQAQSSALPTLWGLPKSRVTERKCIAFGDDCCELKYQWYEHRRPLPTLLGIAAGGGVAAALWIAGLAAAPLLIPLPIIGGLVGYLLELRRTNRANLAIGEEMSAALVDLAKEDADARREVLALSQRQKEWTRVLEEQVTERTATLEDVVRRLQGLREDLQADVRGMSHDLQNPLIAIRGLNDYALESEDRLPADIADCLRDQRDSIQQMDSIFKELMGKVRPDAPLLRLAPQTVETGPLLEQLRRRVRALVIGREIRVSVLASRETPPRIETDLLLFDRVIDNLLTNAAKYTERGSIVVELDGKPGFLTVKISDTGRGIAQESIRKIFEPAGSSGETRAAHSHGVGLSVVVKLLGQIGGRLEVMSLSGEGTTFWAHFPVELAKADADTGADGAREGDAEAMVDKVVTFHKARAR